MLKKMAALSVLGLVLLAGCAKEGPMGPAGPAGPAGTTLLTQFTVTFSTANGNLPDSDLHPINVPEIQGRQSSTFVEMYWTTSTTNESWMPLADGDTDTSAAVDPYPWAAVSWTNGTITVTGMKEGQRVYIKVLQHN